MFHVRKTQRRAALRKEPLTREERAVVERYAPYAAALGDADRAELEGLVRVFLAEKTFEGCGGLEVTDEMRLTIAVHACRLLLHRETEMFPGLESILVYPSAYRVPPEEDDDGIVADDPDECVGESWMQGVVVLAWDEVSACAAQPLDGKNVVLHEFAHQLDSEDGSMNGTPALGSDARRESWGRVMTDEIERLTDALDAGKRSDIDAYAATDEAEFFAVVTEMFFGKASTLKRRHPELYAELAAFYRQDPAGE